MADGMYDPVAGLIDPDTYSKIADQWTSFLDQPGGRAGVLSAGLALMQPGAWGQNGAAQIGSAIGAAGEASGRVETMNLKQREAASKEDSRAAAASLAEARAANAGQAAQLQESRLAQQKTLAQLTASNQLRRLHSDYVNKTQAINQRISGDVLNPPAGRPGHNPPLPIVPFEQWLQSDPAARQLAERAGLPVSAPGSTSAPAPAVGGLSPQDQQALDWANQNPDDPRSQAIRQKLGQ